MKEEQETGWVGAIIKCDLCGHESLSVHHVSCDKLECVNCEHMSHFEIIECCPNCGERENIHTNYDYYQKHRPVEDYLCNECGTYFKPKIQ